MTDKDLLPVLQSIAESLQRLAPQAARGQRSRRLRRLRLAGRGLARAGEDRLAGPHQPAARHRPGEGDADREHRAFRQGPARQQRPALGRARHRQELAGEGNPRARSTSAARAKLKLIEIHREDLVTLPKLLGIIRNSPKHRCIIFCDDLSFDTADTSYKSLKAVLEGGIEGRPSNVLFYATSNRRHLMAREMIENERSTAINPSEAVEEKVSLSDRFGLWIGFHNCDQDTFFAIIEGYAKSFKLPIETEELRAPGDRMADDPRRALGARRLAVHPGSGRPPRQDHRRLKYLAELQTLDLPAFAQVTPDLGGGACAQMLLGDAALDQAALTREPTSSAPRSPVSNT